MAYFSKSEILQAAATIVAARIARDPVQKIDAVTLEGMLCDTFRVIQGLGEGLERADPTKVRPAMQAAIERLKDR